jgi:hypothetical protein
MPGNRRNLPEKENILGKEQFFHEKRLFITIFMGKKKPAGIFYSLIIFNGVLGSKKKTLNFEIRHPQGTPHTNSA